MSDVLTPEQEDEFLDLVLPCQNELEYQRALVVFGKKYGRSAELSLDEGEKWLLRRAIRRTDYQYRMGERGEIWSWNTNRAFRSKCPWTWVEHRMLDWAGQKHAESKKEITIEYLAYLFQRTQEEVKEEIERRQKVKFGIEGLF